MIAVAETLGDYRVERRLGEGSSATVYLAQDLRQGRWVALKVFAPGEPVAVRERGELRQRFLREAEVVKRLTHPDIVTVHEVGETAGRVWLAMELVRGCPLDRYTQSRMLLPPPVVLGLAGRVARALAHAHTQGVVHRDIKPSNVIVDLAGQGLKLADFGTARLLDSCRTRTELMLGSPAYMAPELLAGSAATAASDLYALGVLLFELLSGRRPHESASMGELLRQVAAEPAPDLQRLRPALPAAVAAMVAQLLAKQPSQRPGSAAQAADELAGLQTLWPATAADDAAPP